MSIQLITAIAWSGILASSLIYSLFGDKLGRSARPASILNLTIALITLTVAIVSAAPVAAVVAGAWILTALRALTTTAAADPLTPHRVSSAAANSWSSVAGQGNPVGFGSMVRLVV